jgi:hypothetical protein
VYTSKKPDLKREESDLALEILVLAHGWLMMDVQNVMQGVMMRPKMIDPFNLDYGEPFHYLDLIDYTNFIHFFLKFVVPLVIRCRNNCINIVLIMSREILVLSNRRGKVIGMLATEICLRRCVLYCTPCLYNVN